MIPDTRTILIRIISNFIIVVKPFLDFVLINGRTIQGSHYSKNFCIDVKCILPEQNQDTYQHGCHNIKRKLLPRA